MFYLYVHVRISLWLFYPQNLIYKTENTTGKKYYFLHTSIYLQVPQRSVCGRNLVYEYVCVFVHTTGYANIVHKYFFNVTVPHNIKIFAQQTTSLKSLYSCISQKILITLYGDKTLNGFLHATLVLYRLLLPRNESIIINKLGDETINLHRLLFIKFSGSH